MAKTWQIRVCPSQIHEAEAKTSPATSDYNTVHVVILITVLRKVPNVNVDVVSVQCHVWVACCLLLDAIFIFRFSFFLYWVSVCDELKVNPKSYYIWYLSFSVYLFKLDKYHSMYLSTQNPARSETLPVPTYKRVKVATGDLHPILLTT